MMEGDIQEKVDFSMYGTCFRRLPGCWDLIL